MVYYFSMAGLRLACDMPFELGIGPESRPFLSQEAAWDIYAEFIPVRELPPIPKNAVMIGGRYYVGEEIWHRISTIHPPYAYVRWQGKRATCYYLKDWERELNTARCLWDLLGLENIFLIHEGLILHSSFVCWKNQGILFSAPSGTGKSTQADLWEKYLGSRTLNGDRAALRCIHDTWTAFGLPYAGSSGIYRNEAAPVAAIVTLSQGPENEITRLTPMEAVRRLLPEFTIHRWDGDFVSRAMSLLLQLVQQVPVYHLSCRPDEGAVRLLHDTIKKEVPL